MQNRWLVSEMSGSYQRFDDVAVQAQMEMRNIKKKYRAELLSELMTMESAAIEILNRKD